MSSYNTIQVSYEGFRVEPSLNSNPPCNVAEVGLPLESVGRNRFHWFDDAARSKLGKSKANLDRLSPIERSNKCVLGPHLQSRKLNLATLA
jgi:hypothetical protein